MKKNQQLGDMVNMFPLELEGGDEIGHADNTQVEAKGLCQKCAADEKTGVKKKERS